jgi:hypothetical protein
VGFRACTILECDCKLRSILILALPRYALFLLIIGVELAPLHTHTVRKCKIPAEWLALINSISARLIGPIYVASCDYVTPRNSPPLFLLSPSLFAMASTAATPILQEARTCSHCGREQSPSRFVNRRYRHRLTATCLACRQSCRSGSHAPVGAEPSSSATASSEIVVGRPTPLIASDPTPTHEASSTAALSEIVLGRPAPTQRAPPSASMGRSPQSPAADHPLHASRPLPVLLPRGQDSGDTPSAAEARRRLHACLTSAHVLSGNRRRYPRAMWLTCAFHLPRL